MVIYEKVVIALISSALSACASVGSVPPRKAALVELSVASANADGVRIRTSGYAAVTLGGVYLFFDRSAAIREDYAGGIDLVLMDEIAKQVAANGACVEVGGVFVAFDGDTVGAGYLRSSIGLVELESIRAVPCNGN